MRIPVIAAIGRGHTLLSSFDDALHRSGVHNYNLLALSSVIPPCSRVMPVGCYSAPADEHGHRLYVVKADCRSDEPGQAVAAGIGWYQWGDDRGVFVEHEAAGPSSELAEAEVARLIRVSLRDLCLARGVDFEERRAGSRTVAATVDGLPTTVLVLAIYQVEAWDMASPGLRDRVSLAGQ